jgi:erythromycin esterase-like protein
MKKLIYILAFMAFACDNNDDPKADDQDDATLESAIVPLEDEQSLDTLITTIANDKFVLLGEASHGTAEYYTWRATLSQRLIQEKGFNIIGVEGDWPGLYQLNQYIKGSDEFGNSAQAVLQQLDRWPTWMWANEEIATFAEWLRTHNMNLPPESQVSFYGLDVYSLRESMEEVLSYLQTADPSNAQLAQNALNCFAPYGEDEFAYGSAATTNNNCADELATLLAHVESHHEANMSEATFNALQNAQIAMNAERYYTTAVRSNAESWNVRDRHMMQTVNNLIEHHGSASKIIIWQHNTHVGDARATDMEAEGMVNVGQLVREQHEGEGVYIIGFGSYSGEVIASSQWEGAVRTMNVPNAIRGSWENRLHDSEPANKIVFLETLKNNSQFSTPIGHRAIGVVYNPSAEQGNYVPSVMPQRYDAFIFIDETHALTPLTPSGSRKKKASRLINYE